jgi:hypothetical protein
LPLLPFISRACLPNLEWSFNLWRRETSSLDRNGNAYYN